MCHMVTALLHQYISKKLLTSGADCIMFGLTNSLRLCLSSCLLQYTGDLDIESLFIVLRASSNLQIIANTSKEDGV